MIIAVILGISLGVVAVAVATDVARDYREGRPSKDPKPPTKRVKVDNAEQEVKRGIAAYRNLKRIELGLHMMSEREVRVDRPRGAHRRLQVS